MSPRLVLGAAALGLAIPTSPVGTATIGNGTIAFASDSDIRAGPVTCGSAGNVPHDRSPVVSRDGTTLGFSRELPHGRTRTVVVAADSAGSPGVSLRGYVVALAPDGGEALLVEERRAGGDLIDEYFLGDTRSGEARLLSADEVREVRRRWRTPEWSPDGRFYVDVRDADPFRAELWLVPADGGPGLMLFRPAEPFRQLGWPAWSPDGSTIAFLSAPKGGGDEYATAVWVVRPDGTGARQITNTYASFGLAWSPDGRRLAFAEETEKEASRIAVVRPDGTGLRWLTRTHYASGGQSSVSPDWLDNGRLVFEARQWTYARTEDRVVVIQSIGADGKGERRLTYHCHLGLRGRDRAYYASHLPDVVKTFGGDDVVHAGPGDDDVDPGRGDDRVFAGPGRDLVRARDGERDQVDCGPGHDAALVDPRDRVVGCERVRRRRT